MNDLVTLKSPVNTDSTLVSLGGACRFIRGVSFDKAAARREPAPGLVPILRAGNIGIELNLSDDLIWVPRSFVSDEQILRSGDIVICMSSGSPAVVGKVAILDREWLGSAGAFCGILRPKTQLLSEYLLLWLRSPMFISWRDRMARGANIQNLRFSELERLSIDLPSLGVQHERVNRFTSITGITKKARSSLAKCVEASDALPSSIFRHLFCGIVPVSAGDIRGSPSPNGWRWHLLTDVAKLESGHTPSRSRPDWWGGDIPWLALPDIRNLDGRWALDTSEHTNPAGIANSSARVLPRGTVALSRTASVGFVCVFGCPMATSQDFVNWVCGPDLHPWFLAQALIASRDYLLNIASGAVHKTIYMPTVKSFRVCTPPYAEQRRIAAHLLRQLRATHRLRAALQAEAAALDAQPAALLRQIFGEAA